jgi:outer membrane protein, adhesin transport system
VHPMRHRSLPGVAKVLPIGLALVLSGCMGGGPGVGMFAASRPSDPAITPDGQGEVTRAASDRGARSEAQSPVIQDLIARTSILPKGGAYAQVAEAVLSASQGAAAAELRVARLKAEARATNWLPSIGPSVSLTSLSSIAAGLLLEQALFDNGRRRAERAFAAADVEMAAVALAADMNARVHDGIARHIEAEQARAQGRVADAAVVRMAEFSRIVEGRVEGGIADRSEARVVAQKLAELRATAARDREAEATARAELAALTDGRAPAVSGLSDLPAPPATVTPLSVLRAEGEGRRMVAQARIDRASHLPGISAGASVSVDGIKPAVKLGADKLFNRGTSASLQALEATETLATQKLEESRDDADRRLVSLERQIAELAARQADGRIVLDQTRATHQLYADQFEAGLRPLMDVVSMSETLARMEHEQAGLAYDMVLLRLRMAQERGVLVDGARM